MSVTIGQWADEVLKVLHINDTASAVTSLEGWAEGEGGGTANQAPYVAKYNPLNTTLHEPGSTNFAPGSNVQSYQSVAQGVAATASTLDEPAYSSIVGELRAGASPSEIWSSVMASPWGTHDLGGMTTSEAQQYGSTPLTGTTTAGGGILSDLSAAGSALVDPGHAAAKSTESGIAGEVARGVGDAIDTTIGKLLDPIVHPAILAVLALILVLVGVYVIVGKQRIEEGAQVAAEGAAV